MTLSFRGGVRPSGIGAALPLLVATLAIAVRFWSFGVDDAYIYYRVAANLAQSEGWTYNAGERVNATTSPAWTVLLALGEGIFGSAAVTAHALGAAATLLSGWIFLTLISDSLRPFSATASALLLVSHPILVESFGLETHLLLLASLLALRAGRRERPLELGGSLALAVLARPDAAILAALLLLRLGWRRRRVPWIALGSLAAVGALWLAFSIPYFGSPFSNTLFAKRAQGALGLLDPGLSEPFSALPPFLQGIVVWWKRAYTLPLPKVAAALRYAPLATAGILVLLGSTHRGLRRAPAVVWILWAVAHSLVYSLLGVPHYHWYYVPVLLAFATLVGAGLSRLEEWASRRGRGAGKLAAGLACAPLLLQHGGIAYVTTYTVPGPREEAYATVGRWLRANTTPETSVAAAEIGVIGYESRRPIVDLLGLIHREGPRHLRRGELDWWFALRRPDVVLVHVPPWPTEAAAMRRPDFQREYTVWQEFSPPFGTLRLYRRKEDAPRQSQDR